MDTDAKGEIERLSIVLVLVLDWILVENEVENEDEDEKQSGLVMRSFAEIVTI